MVLQYETNVPDIERVTEETLQKAQNLFGQVLQVENGSWFQVFGRLSNGLGLLHNRLWLSEMMVRVGATAEVRKAYASSSSKVKQLRTQTFADPKLFSVLSSHRDLRAPQESGFNPNEDVKFIKDVLLQLERNGSSLPPDRLAEYKEVSARLAEKETAFCARVGEDLSQILATDEELDGLPKEFIQNLKSEDGKRVITMKYPDVLPVLKKAKKEHVRRRARECMDNRAGFENVKILKDAVLLREKLAHLLGYKNWADYRLEVKLPKTPSRVEEFSANVASKLKSLAHDEMQVLLKLKQQECEENGENFDGKINDWDLSYYSNIHLEKEYGLNDEEIRSYFPIEFVTEQILGTYQSMLGLKFTDLTQSQPGSLWNETVKFYRVDEAATGEFVGHFYLDLLPRDGKYSHACAYPVIDGISFFEENSVKRQHPIAVMIANFTRPTTTRPSLLSHSEVKTYCHEFGHVMHNICSRVRHSESTWLYAGMDFIECPSQMMENFIWQHDVIKRISKNYQTGEAMSDVLIEKLISSKNVGIGIQKSRQVFMGLYDIKIHLKGSSLFSETDDGSALNQIWNEMKLDMTGIEAVHGTNYVASWLHLCSDYDAGYYSYLWSEVFSSDLFSRFEAEGILSAKVGADYRTLVLQPAASEDGMILLGNFLGREPNEISFLKSLGVKA